MADSKISALTQVSAVADANEFAVNEAGTTKKATGSQIVTYIENNIDLSNISFASTTGGLDASNLNDVLRELQDEIIELDADSVSFTSTTGGISASNVGDALRELQDEILQDRWIVNGSDIYYDQGNVGIGTTSPAVPLHVSTSAGDTDIRLDTSSATTDPRIIFAPNASSEWSIGVDSSDSDKFKFGAGAALTTNTRVTVQTTGEVGIGTDAPGANLHIDGSSNPSLLITLSGSNRALLGDSGSQNSGDLLLYDSSGVLKTLIRGEGNSYINTGSNVGINTTSPGASLHVSAGDILLDNTQSLQWEDAGGTARNVVNVDASDNVLIGNSNLDHITFNVGTLGEAVRIEDVTGFVGIGTTAPSNLLDVEKAPGDYFLYGSNPRVFLKTATGINGFTIEGDTTPFLTRNDTNTEISWQIDSSHNTTWTPIDATSGTTTVDSTAAFFTGKYWNGAASATAFQAKVYAKVTSTSSPFGGLSLGTTGGSGNDALLIENTTGFVGIGTTTPDIVGKLHVNQASTTGAIPSLHLEQDDVSEEAIRFTGQAAAATLTQTFVAEADVTTATRQGFVKINIQDEGDQITDGAYYVAFYSLA